ncbi:MULTISPECIES: MoxR family ATPase [unclassified Apibacter]|uniref:AAA family ATPase n=1 Tax=unclassified Apibacter TaxID=2630820 RepID=UPI00132C7766|nr:MULTISPECIES: MoxR family ATPase [unclassified Apibacter]MCX8676740.1 MoxR family ATPase [Apibacter sp. B3919]MXO24877.1 AAA domain-containing protein [Apibacter sp. B3924]MXO26121.1 AAA domain-containing protein [Apibacter sp. B3813]MXO28072.1 AAA domain-containing protein [Apibacter sp. B3913]MXO29568.1 AAA domain-containing protein [Apibacter sp. B3912]
MEYTSTSEDIKIIIEKVREKSKDFSLLSKEINQVIVGQKYMINRLLIGLLSNGHVLLEGVPGLAKTLAIKTLAEALDGEFSRIQFTPDLLPADVLGTLIYNMKENDFSIKKGPIFANFILADEINRSPAKVQSALLEAMQEKQVTIGDETFKLKEPFLVLATQNPIDQEGTYPLPEAQIDRFMLKCVVSYPDFEQERTILRQNISGEKHEVKKIITLEKIFEARELVKEIYMDEKIESYILNVIFATRYPEKYNMPNLKPYILFGSSPRGSISMALAAKANAFLNQRGFVVPEDVKSVAKDVLRHRVGITYEAEAENITSEDIIDQILNSVKAP